MRKLRHREVKKIAQIKQLVCFEDRIWTQVIWLQSSYSIPSLYLQKRFWGPIYTHTRTQEIILNKSNLKYNDKLKYSIPDPCLQTRWLHRSAGSKIATLSFSCPTPTPHLTSHHFHKWTPSHTDGKLLSHPVLPSSDFIQGVVDLCGCCSYYFICLWSVHDVMLSTSPAWCY